jgi:MFS family permease
MTVSNTRLWIIYVNVALYAMCFQLQRPLEPFLVEKLIANVGGDAATEYARLQSFFSVLQTLGSLVSGMLLDRLGAKGGFVLSFAASALCYLLLSQASSVSILYLSKVPSLFQSGFLCAQMAITQCTPEGMERVRALGMLTTSYTVGAVLGPFIGGIVG